MISHDFRPVAFFAALFAGTFVSLSAKADPVKPVPGLNKVEHIIVIYLENRSFDHLYGLFPGAEGLAQASAVAPQVDKDGGAVLHTAAIQRPGA